MTDATVAWCVAGVLAVFAVYARWCVYQLACALDVYKKTCERLIGCLARAAETNDELMQRLVDATKTKGPV